jgi:hypothetical protein
VIRPFVILALPRSRTFWLSNFLTYRDWHCGHDELRHVRTIGDVQSWLSQPFTGTVETAAASFWRLIPSGVRVVIVRRSVEEVVNSMVASMPPGVFDRDGMTRLMTRLDLKLSQAAKGLPNALVVTFEELKTEEACSRVFEYCLPYPHDPAWWRAVSAVNLQINMPAFMRYVVAHKAQMAGAAHQAKTITIAGIKARASAAASEIDGVDLSLMDFETFLDEGKSLFAEHSKAIGEPPTSFQEKNIPFLRAIEANGGLQIAVAKSNGRMFGYLMSVIGPSLEAPGRKSATQTAFFASKEFPGLGLKLERFAVSEARSVGVSEVLLRAGTRGDGDRLGILYRRLGAERDGELYRLRF